jgi:hypothetical protein
MLVGVNAVWCRIPKACPVEHRHPENLPTDQSSRHEFISGPEVDRTASTAELSDAAQLLPKVAFLGGR